MLRLRRLMCAATIIILARVVVTDPFIQHKIRPGTSMPGYQIFDLGNPDWWTDKANQVLIPVTAILFTAIVQRLFDAWQNTERGETRNWIRRMYWIPEIEYLPLVTRGQKHRPTCAGGQDPSHDAGWRYAQQNDPFEHPEFTDSLPVTHAWRISDGTERSHPHHTDSNYLPNPSSLERPRRRSP